MTDRVSQRGFEPIRRWRELVETSYAHNSELYANLAETASAEEIHAFLLWDAKQPPFFQFLQGWLPRAPASVRPSLEAHLREEIAEDHAGLFRRMMAELARQFPVTGVAPDAAVLQELNYTFSSECAVQESFEFFSGGFFATELMSAKRCAQLLRGLRRFGVREEALAYLDLHAESDLQHVDEVITGLLGPLLRSGGNVAEIERGLRDRLERSGIYLRWYWTHGRRA